MQVRLIVPNHLGDDLGKEIDPTKIYGIALISITGEFTATQSTRGWIDARGVMIVGPVTVFDADIDADCVSLDHKRSAVHRLAKIIAKELDVYCIHLRIDGEVQYVAP